MNVLVLNCGSSTLKFQVFWSEPGGAPRRRIRGAVEGFGPKAVLRLRADGAGDRAPRTEESLPAAGHQEAVSLVLRRLESEPWRGLLNGGTGAIQAVGHRVVHGGAHYIEPVRIDETVLENLHALETLAPLHNGPGIAGIRAALELLPVPMVAVFDTAFHHTLPEVAWRYAIPWDVAEHHGIRRYGFHGTSYRYVLERWCELTGTPAARARLIILHLGNGASAVAIRDGRSVDTTMGLTPLEGLMMGTRSGDLDPAVVIELAHLEGLSAHGMERLLNSRSGLLGVSGLSADMRRLLEAQDTHPRARLAVDMFCYRARKAIGAYLAALGGAQAVVFTGGIGENAPAVRARICEPMAWCGMRLDPQLNAQTLGRDGCISPPSTALPVYVIPTDEEALIARDTARLAAQPA
jgi:acetate kinase